LTGLLAIILATGQRQTESAIKETNDCKNQRVFEKR